MGQGTVIVDVGNGNSGELFFLAGTWVLTPGTHVGVAKLIGSAVKEYIAETGSSKLEDVVLLGVVSYHSIAGGDSLRYKNKEVKAEERQVRCHDVASIKIYITHINRQYCTALHMNSI